MNNEITTDERVLPLWPKNQVVQAIDEQRKNVRTRFKDYKFFHPSLSEAIEARLNDPAVVAQHHQALGVTKLYGVENSIHPAVQLLNARAMALYKIAAGLDRGIIDTAWVIVFQSGEYFAAHSHVRALKSVVYCLDDGKTNGAADADNRFAGQLCIIDPRYPPCCKLKAGCVTNPVILKMRPGPMVSFPANLVHAVHPYEGTQPRITFARNITEAKLPGDILSVFNLQGAARFDPD